MKPPSPAVADADALAVAGVEPLGDADALALANWVLGGAK